MFRVLKILRWALLHGRVCVEPGLRRCSVDGDPRKTLRFTWEGEKRGKKETGLEEMCVRGQEACSDTNVVRLVSSPSFRPTIQTFLTLSLLPYPPSFVLLPTIFTSHPPLLHFANFSIRQVADYQSTQVAFGRWKYMATQQETLIRQGQAPTDGVSSERSSILSALLQTIKTLVLTATFPTPTSPTFT